MGPVSALRHTFPSLSSSGLEDEIDRGIRTVTGLSTYCTFASSMSSSFALEHTSLTTDSGTSSHRFSCSICLDRVSALSPSTLPDSDELTCLGRTTWYREKEPLMSPSCLLDYRPVMRDRTARSRGRILCRRRGRDGYRRLGECLTDAVV